MSESTVVDSRIAPEGMNAEERMRCGLDIDAPKLKAALRELSQAFVNGEQSRYGMRIPAEPYRDGDLVCGGAFRLIEQLQTELERERIRLAACGVAALCNLEPEAHRLAPDNQYYSVSYSDVCKAVDREIALRVALTADASRLDYIEDRLKATGEIYFVRTIDGDMQMNTADCVGYGSGSTLRDVIDAEMKESERG